MSAIIVTGTDTGIGKTIFAAGLTAALGGQYWKPVQSGLEDETDTQIVARLSGAETLPEAYRLNMPASPHLAAEDMGLDIDLDRLALPETDAPLVVEGAGGIMVPLTRRHYFLDLFARWNAPVLLVARTQLGTINHSTLSVMALFNTGCPLAGIAFVGDAEPAVEDTIAEMSNVPNLGRLPMIGNLTRASLATAFSGIDMDAIRRHL